MLKPPKAPGAMGVPGGKTLGSHSKGRGMPETITGAAPLPRMMGQYGKTPPTYLAAGSGDPIDPTGHPGAVAIRGGSGGVKSHPKEGGLGPGPMGATGSDTMYPKDTDQS